MIIIDKWTVCILEAAADEIPQAKLQLKLLTIVILAIVVNLAPVNHRKDAKSQIIIEVVDCCNLSNNS